MRNIIGLLPRSATTLRKNLETVETMNILLIFLSFNCLAVPKYKKETQLQIGNYEYEILLIFSL